MSRRSPPPDLRARKSYTDSQGYSRRNRDDREYDRTSSRRRNDSEYDAGHRRKEWDATRDRGHGREIESRRFKDGERDGRRDSGRERREQDRAMDDGSKPRDRYDSPRNREQERSSRREKDRDRDRAGPSSRRSASPPRRSSHAPSGSRSPSAVDKDLEAKMKPNFGSSGLLAAATNTVKNADGSSTLLKYNEPPEARKPVVGWRLYVFKGSEQVGEFPSDRMKSTASEENIMALRYVTP